MPSTLPNARPSDPVRDLESIRPASVKAGLRSDTIGLGPVVADAVVAHYGSVKAAAISLGNVDPSQMMREFKAGNLARLDRDPAARAAIVTAVHRAFAEDDPALLRARLIRTIRRSLDDLAEAL